MTMLLVVLNAVETLPVLTKTANDSIISPYVCDMALMFLMAQISN
jgi:hypothetical protein